MLFYTSRLSAEHLWKQLPNLFQVGTAQNCSLGSRERFSAGWCPGDAGPDSHRSLLTHSSLAPILSCSSEENNLWENKYDQNSYWQRLSVWKTEKINKRERLSHLLWDPVAGWWSWPLALVAKRTCSTGQARDKAAAERSLTEAVKWFGAFLMARCRRRVWWRWCGFAEDGGGVFSYIWERMGNLHRRYLTVELEKHQTLILHRMGKQSFHFCHWTESLILQ